MDATLAAHCAIRETVLYRDLSFSFLTTKAFVQYPMEKMSNTRDAYCLKLTGIPPHVLLLTELKGIKSELSSMIPNFRTEMERLLDDRTMGGTLSETRIQNLLDSALTTGRMADMYDTIQQLREGTLGGNTDRGEINEGVGDAGRLQDNDFDWFLHMVDRKYRRVPEGWRFPRTTLVIAYSQWHAGDRVRKICPLKRLTIEDVRFVDRGRRNLYDFWLVISFFQRYFIIEPVSMSPKTTFQVGL